jgi:hypothetical protein
MVMETSKMAEYQFMFKHCTACLATNRARRWLANESWSLGRAV